MPPSLICTRICPPPATEGPPPGGGPSVRFKRRLNNHSTFLGTILRVTILVFPSTMEILCLTGQKCSENRKRGVSYEEGSWNEQTASCAGRAQRWNSGPPRPSAASGPSTLGRHSWTVIATAAELVCTRKASGTAGGFPLPFCTEGRSQLPVRRQISWRLGPVETMVRGASMCFSMKST